MALTIKHKSDGSYYEQGDTQGLLVSLSAPTVFINPPLNQAAGNDYSEANAMSLSYGTRHDFGTISGKRFYIPAGIYAVQLPACILDIADNFKYTFVASYTRTGNRYSFRKTFGPYEDVYGRSDAAELIEVLDGGYLVFGVVKSQQALDIKVVYWDSAPFIVTQLLQNVPYLVANKGALVSGDAFQFSLEGQGFPFNLPHSNTDWRVGTNNGDGSEIWRIVRPVANPDTWGVGQVDLGVPCPVGLNAIVDYFITVKHSISAEYDTTIPRIFREIRLGKLINGNLGGYLPYNMGSMVANSAWLVLTYCKTPGA